jgi:hypothetical protein
MCSEVAHATTQLEKLAAELGERGFNARLHLNEGRPTFLKVINTVAPVLTEQVLTAPQEDGALWFWFPWPEAITPITEVQAAADRIERVLAEVGRPAR